MGNPSDILRMITDVTNINAGTIFKTNYGGIYRSRKGAKRNSQGENQYNIFHNKTFLNNVFRYVQMVVMSTE